MSTKNDSSIGTDAVKRWQFFVKPAIFVSVCLGAVYCYYHLYKKENNHQEESDDMINDFQPQQIENNNESSFDQKIDNLHKQTEHAQYTKTTNHNAHTQDSHKKKKKKKKKRKKKSWIVCAPFTLIKPTFT
eukprot:170652_1